MEPGPDGSICQPGIRCKTVLTPAFEIEDAGVLMNTAMLVRDADFASLLCSPVVVVREHPLLILGRDYTAQAKIKPGQVGLVLVDHFVDHAQPLVKILLAGRSTRCVRLAVESGVFAILCIELIGRLEVLPGKGMVEGGDELHTALADGLL